MHWAPECLMENGRSPVSTDLSSSNAMPRPSEVTPTTFALTEVPAITRSVPRLLLEGAHHRKGFITKVQDISHPPHPQRVRTSTPILTLGSCLGL